MAHIQSKNPSTQRQPTPIGDAFPIFLARARWPATVKHPEQPGHLCASLRSHPAETGCAPSTETLADWLSRRCWVMALQWARYIRRSR